MLAPSVALLLLFWQWQPIGGVVWSLVATTAFMLVAIRLEERDLVHAHGAA